MIAIPASNNEKNLLIATRKQLLHLLVVESSCSPRVECTRVVIESWPRQMTWCCRVFWSWLLFGADLWPLMFSWPPAGSVACIINLSIPSSPYLLRPRHIGQAVILKEVALATPSCGWLSPAPTNFVFYSFFTLLHSCLLVTIAQCPCAILVVAFDTHLLCTLLL